MNSEQAKAGQIQSINVGGVFVATASRHELAELCVADCQAARSRSERPQPKVIFDLNGQGLALYHTNPEYRALVDCADLVHADGGFLITASKRLCAKPIAERSATTDMLHDLAAACSDASLSFYLLGGTQSVNASCATELARLYPKLKIVGARDGYFSKAERKAVIDEINEARPDVLWVGMGKPLEQEFAIAARDHLTCGWIITCGGCYNYITGDYPRAPAWMQNSNLEWLHRMVTRPRALFWRYFWTTPFALYLTLRHSSKALRSD